MANREKSCIIHKIGRQFQYFGNGSVAVESLWLLVPLKCGMHEDEAVSLYLRMRYLIEVLLRKRFLLFNKET